jgi:quercetin dioxygenase-like cupin family protein
MTTEASNPDETADLNVFDLDKEIAEINGQKPWQTGHSAKLLFKAADLRLVLIVMEKGSSMKEHHADGTISVQMLKGSVRFTAQGRTHALAGNGVLTLGASIPHSLDALDDSALLLTVSWPDAAKLETMKHRGYGS